MQIQLDKRWTKKVKGRLEKYNFEIGVLNNKTYYKPKPKSAGGKSLAGGPARLISTKASDKTIANVSKYMRDRTNYLQEPFKGADQNKDIINFTKEFFRFAFGLSKEKRLINLLQAIVRNPLARRDYGPNAMSTARRKGFDRFGIDSGQLFKNITAKITRVK